MATFDTALLKIFNQWEQLTGEPLQIAANAAAAPGLAPGAIVAGRYRLDKVLGAGGMGRVWLGQDQLEKREVALKEMQVSSLRAKAGAVDAHSDTLEALFKREFFTMTKLAHPNTVKVFDYGTLNNGDRFITMEVVKGQDLQGLLKKGPVELKQLYRILVEMARVLHFIHSRLYVHCDIKSENVRLTDRGAVKLMDFGLMHQLGTPAGGTLKGTPQYMPPEMPKGGVIDARSDLYSLGVMAFELAAGKLPFQGRTLTDILQQHLHSPVPPLLNFRDVPKPFADLVAKLMAKEQKDRFADAAELLKELEKLSGYTVELGSAAQRTSYLAAADLIGRDTEAQALKDAFTLAQAGKAESLFVAAPGGVGKTRILQEFRLHVKLLDAPFTVGFCRAEGQPPLQPFVQAFSPLLDFTPKEVLDAQGPQLVKLFPALTGKYAPASAPNPVVDKVMVFGALTTWLKAAAKARPFIACVEDLHWADAGTLEHLNVAIRALKGEAGMVLGTFRSNEVDRMSLVYQTIDEGYARKLELGPLTPTDTVSLLSATLKNFRAPEQFAARLHTSTQGNPFFVTETLRALIEANALALTEGAWSVVNPEAQLPASIDDAVSARVQTLEKARLDLCQRLAPIGRHLPLPLLRAVAGLSDDALFPALDELVERQFIQAVEQDYYFVHETVRAAVYKGTPEELRKDHHQRVAEALESQSTDKAASAGALGYHYARGRDLKKAVDYLLMAGGRALQGKLPVDATKLLQQAVDLLEKSERPDKEALMLDSWAKLVEVAFSANPPTAIQYAGKLFGAWSKRLDLKAGAQQLTKERKRYQRLPKMIGHRMLVKSWAERPLKASSTDPHDILPRLFLYRGLMATGLGAVGMVDKCHEVAQLNLDDNPEADNPYRAMALISRNAALLHRGEWKAQQEQAREAHEILERHAASIGVMPERLHWFHAASCYWILIGQALRGEVLDEKLIARGLELATKHGFGDIRFFVRSAELLRSCVIGDPDAFAKAYGELSDIVRRLGFPRLQESRLFMWVPFFYIQRQDTQLQAAATAKMEGFLQVMKDAWLQRYGMLYRAAAAVEGAKWAEAEGLTEALLKVSRESHFSRMNYALTLRARVLLQQNKKDDARALANEALTRSRDVALANPLDEIFALRTLGEIDVGAEAAASLNKALEISKATKNVLQQGLCLLQLARVLAPTDRAAAGSAAADAEACFRAIKADAWIARVDEFRRKAANA